MIPEKTWRNHGISNEWAIATAQGLQRLDWLQEPPRTRNPTYTYEKGMTTEEKIQTDIAINEFLLKDAIYQAAPDEDLFFSNLFTIAQIDKTPVCLDARPLNHFVEHLHFKMEGIQTLRHMVRPNDHLIKIDIKDAYLHIPLHPMDQGLLTF
jgi:hypothetical protein